MTKNSVYPPTVGPLLAALSMVLKQRAVLCGGAASQKVYILHYLISVIRPSNHFNK